MIATGETEAPAVRILGEVQDIDGMTLAIGVDHDTVALYVGGWLSADGVRLDRNAREKFVPLYVAACSQAAKQAPECDGQDDAEEQR